MDGAQQLKVICVSQPCVQGDDVVVAKASVQVRRRVSPLTSCWTTTLPQGFCPSVGP